MRYRKVCGFESHLGHSISPRQRGFCFNVLTKLAVASSDGLGRGLWPGRRGPIQVCEWRVQCPGWWALRLLSTGVMRFLLPVLSGWAWVSNTSSWVTGAGTTCSWRTDAKILGGLLPAGGEGAPLAYLSDQIGCGQCPHLSLLFRAFGQPPIYALAALFGAGVSFALLMWMCSKRGQVDEIRTSDPGTCRAASSSCVRSSEP